MIKFACLFSLLFILFPLLVSSQSLALAITNGRNAVPAGDQTFNISAQAVTINPNTSCSFTFNNAVEIDPNAIIANCDWAPGPIRILNCTVSVIGTSFVFRGDVTLVEGCLNGAFIINGDCDGSTSVANTTISNSVAIINTALIPDDLIVQNNDTIDFAEFNNFTMTARLTNDGDCLLDTVSCDIIFPTPFVSENETGLVELITSDNRSTVLQSGCGKVADTLTCLTGFTLNPQSNYDIVMVFRQTGNGLMNFTMSCTSTGLIASLSSTDSFLSIDGIGIPPPPVIPPVSSGSNGPDLIVDVAIPLAIFGFVMCVLWTIIIIVVVVYCVYTKLFSSSV